MRFKKQMHENFKQNLKVIIFYIIPLRPPDIKLGKACNQNKKYFNEVVVSCNKYVMM